MMGDYTFSLPTLLVLVPAAGGLITMSMITRRAAGIASMLTFAAHLALLAASAMQLGRFRDAFGPGAVPECGRSATGSDPAFILAQCHDWFPQWGIEYHVALGWASLGLVALVSLVTVCATAFVWWADRPRPAPLHGLLWLGAASLCGLFVSRDLVLFYVFFELMLVPMIVLVGGWGGTQRVRAALTMFIYTLLGSLPMLVGVIATGVAANRAIDRLAQDSTVLADEMTPFSLPALADLAAAGRLDLSWWVLASFVFAFAIKAPLVPFHGWLPGAYREAPAEVTAVLSGVVSKAAFFGLLAVVLPLFPELLADGWSDALIWFGVAGLVYGSLAAFRQPDPRGVVAYSSLAQMGLIVLGLGTHLGAGGAQGVSGAYLQAINHGLISAALFLLIGIIEVRTGERTFARMGGLAAGRPILASLGLLLTLITLAVPGASTFAGELLIIAGAFQNDTAGIAAAAIAGGAVVVAAMYALRLIAGIAMTSDEEARVSADAVRKRFGHDLRAGELALVAPLVLVLLVLSIWPNAVRRAMEQPPVPFAIAGHDPGSEDSEPVSVFDATQESEE